MPSGNSTARTASRSKRAFWRYAHGLSPRHRIGCGGCNSVIQRTWTYYPASSRPSMRWSRQRKASGYDTVAPFMVTDTLNSPRCTLHPLPLEREQAAACHCNSFSPDDACMLLEGGDKARLVIVEEDVFSEFEHFPSLPAREARSARRVVRGRRRRERLAEVAKGP